MSQQGITIVSAGVVVDMGDLEFIQEKVLANNYFQVSGDINNINNTIEFIVPTEKTAFLIEAKITMNSNDFINVQIAQIEYFMNNQIVADLLIDGTRKSKAQFGKHESTSVTNGEGGGHGFGTSSESHFNVLGLSLVGNGSKKIEIKNVLGAGTGFAEMSGYLV